ncbi:hypothetical protein CK203_033818 [Vitis vinifera]|uniref:Non-haem dioxygenase N-terminal domain-containing protein n=1 Tax=Vitis vinifera TaxID=29760 RepID=A0A438IQC6_VITVI|nr:hypothetical protein CK203_033818 [Vitis vinifera]
MAPGTPELQPPKFPSVNLYPNLLLSPPSLPPTPSPLILTKHIASDPQDSIPVIDFSLLTSGNPDQRSKAIQDLHRPVRNGLLHVDVWQVINHGVAESLMKGMIEACRGFFDLTEEEKGSLKKACAGTHQMWHKL